MRNYGRTVQDLVGEIVLDVVSDDGTVTFKTETGDVKWFVDADCCSRTWIENADLSLVRGRVIGVREDSLPDSYYVGHPGPAEEESLSLYGITIQSEKGTGTIDFRNESNGYYGGSMEVEK